MMCLSGDAKYDNHSATDTECDTEADAVIVDVVIDGVMNVAWAPPRAHNDLRMMTRILIRRGIRMHVRLRIHCYGF